MGQVISSVLIRRHKFNRVFSKVDHSANITRIVLVEYTIVSVDELIFCSYYYCSYYCFLICISFPGANYSFNLNVLTTIV